MRKLFNKLTIEKGEHIRVRSSTHELRIGPNEPWLASSIQFEPDPGSYENFLLSSLRQIGEAEKFLVRCWAVVGWVGGQMGTSGRDTDHHRPLCSPMSHGMCRTWWTCDNQSVQHMIPILNPSPIKGSLFVRSYIT